MNPTIPTTRETIARFLADSYSHPHAYRTDEWRNNKELWLEILGRFEERLILAGVTIPQANHEAANQLQADGPLIL